MKKYFGADVGGSLVKTFAKNGDREVLKYYDNNIVVYEGEKDTKDLVREGDVFSSMLDLSIEFKGAKSLKGEQKNKALELMHDISSKRWLVGDLAKNYSTNTRQLTVSRNKFSQPEYYINIISSIVCDMVDNGQKEVEVCLGVLLPAKQFYLVEKEVISDVLGREIIVTNNITEETFVIRIKPEDVIIKAESVIALSSCFIDEKGGINELGKKYARLPIAIIDIGKNTTDCCLVEGGKPNTNSFDSFDFAGKLLMEYFGDEIERRFDGYRPSVEELERTFGKGTISLGATEISVTEEISSANKKFATKLFEKYVEYYLQRIDRKLPQIAAFMFMGGGSTEIDKAKSIRQYFKEEVSKISPHTQSFSPPNIRDANIQGLAVGLKMKYVKDQKNE